jgi:hypothetical protein
MISVPVLLMCCAIDSRQHDNVADGQLTATLLLPATGESPVGVALHVPVLRRSRQRAIYRRSATQAWQRLLIDVGPLYTIYLCPRPLPWFF